MPRIMRDSVDPAAIPVQGTDIAAGYEDGTFANSVAMHHRFPDIPVVMIDVTGQMPQADVRDWETGDKSGSLEQWIIDHNRGYGSKGAVIYCNRSTIPEVRKLTGSQVLGEDYWLWVATLDGTILTPSMQPGLIACQDKGSNQIKANYDESIVFDDHWKPSHAPVKPPVRNHAEFPPGQWLDPRAWSWEQAMVIGKGLDGRMYAFSFNPVTGKWGRTIV